MLFTHKELLEACTRVSGDESPLLEIAEFHQHRFVRPVQGTVVAHRGPRENFASALEFWLWSLWHVERPARVHHAVWLAEAAACEPLDEAGFFAVADVVALNLKRPAPEFLLRRAGYRTGLTMYSGIVLNDLRHAVLAEFTDDFVAIHQRVSL